MADPKERFGLALGGLGGFNLHGAGVLAAVKEKGRVPALVTATSGQILVLAAWIEGRDARDFLLRPDAPSSTAWTALLGMEGVFAPAPGASLSGALSAIAEDPSLLRDPFALASNALPARRYVPTIRQEVFEQAAKTLAEAPFGVAFPVFDDAVGEELLCANARASALLPERSKTIGIDPETIRSGLWLESYGHADAPSGRIDGAYSRCVLAYELRGCDEALIASPLPTSWGPAPPRTRADAANWSLRLPFANSVRADLRRLQGDLDLAAAGLLRDPSLRLKRFSVCAPDRTHGLFEWFPEKEEVWEGAKAKAETLLAA